jgi:mRNA-degrading endonuclease toxin of MazEF toxin-antitoxin module
VSSSLQQGRIVWIELLDPQGRNPKIRPAVILTSTAEIRPDGEIVVAALSSQVDQSPPELSVEVPWHRDGHPRTKLNRRNVVVCSWLATLPVSAIAEDGVGGLMPFAQMSRILEIVRSLRDDSTVPSSPEKKSDQ